jgi:hypothetical protein
MATKPSSKRRSFRNGMEVAPETYGKCGVVIIL